jgi:tetratricopeptide (TPR) repeat protein
MSNSNKMNLEDNILDATQRYLAGKMSEPELADFQKEMNASPELAEEVKTLQALKAALKREEAKKALGLWMTEINPQPDMNYNIEDDINPQPQSENKSKNDERRRKPSNLLRGIVVASAMTLTAFAAYWAWQKVKSPENPQKTETLSSPQAAIGKTIATDYLRTTQPMDNIIKGSGTSSNEPIKQMLIEGMAFYDTKEYAKAIEKLGSPMLKNDDEVQLYLGLSHLYTQNLPKAETILRGIINKGGSFIEPEARRYLALILLMNGQTEEAKTHLKLLINDAAFGEKAKELLEKLK